MAPRKKDKARAAARKHKRALREIYDMCPEAGGEVKGSNDGKEIIVRSQKLISLPESIGTLDRLEALDLSKCPQLLELPDTIGGLKALTELNLYGCSNLAALPESLGTLDGLRLLNLSKCPQLLELPHTIGGLKALTLLNLSGCESLTKLPAAIGELGALTELCLIGCSSLVELLGAAKGDGGLFSGECKLSYAYAPASPLDPCNISGLPDDA